MRISEAPSPSEDLIKALIPILLTPVMGALGPLSSPSPSSQRSMVSLNARCLTMKVQCVFLASSQFLSSTCRNNAFFCFKW